MILDNLQNSSQYEPLGKLFSEAFSYLAKFDPATPDGRHDLHGDDLFMLVQTFETAPATEKTFEAHRHYVDIQYVFSGREAIYYQPTKILKPKADYDPKKDVQFYEGTDEFPLLLRAGQFTILWPQDGHKPSCIWNEACQVRKIVAKIRL